MNLNSSESSKKVNNNSLDHAIFEDDDHHDDLLSVKNDLLEKTLSDDFISYDNFDKTLSKLTDDPEKLIENADYLMSFLDENNVDVLDNDEILTKKKRKRRRKKMKMRRSLRRVIYRMFILVMMIR